jgi:hypothetical protein
MFKPYDKYGGAGDFINSADTKEEIVKIIENNKEYDFGNILDSKTQKVIWINGTDQEDIKELLKEIKE